MVAAVLVPPEEEQTDKIAFLVRLHQPVEVVEDQHHQELLLHQVVLAAVLKTRVDLELQVQELPDKDMLVVEQVVRYPTMEQVVVVVLEDLVEMEQQLLVVMVEME